MPQLNPTPWLYILITLWLITLMLLKPTIMNLLNTSNPPTTPTSLQPTPWDWTWQ